MAAVLTFPTYELADELLSFFFQNNLNTIGWMKGYSLEQRKQSGIENPRENPRKDLSLLVELYCFEDKYTFTEKIEKNRDFLGEYSADIKNLASAVKSNIQLGLEGKSNLVSCKINPDFPTVSIIPLFYTVEKHGEEKEEKKPMIRGLTSEEIDEFVREYVS